MIEPLTYAAIGLVLGVPGMVLVVWLAGLGKREPFEDSGGDEPADS